MAGRRPGARRLADMVLYVPPVDCGRAEVAAPAPARVSSGGESSTSGTESGEASSSDVASVRERALVGLKEIRTRKRARNG